MQINKLTFEIRELPNGWLNERSGHVYPTASHALRAAMRAGRKATRPDGATITKIIWTPRSEIGRQVIAALTGGHQ